MSNPKHLGMTLFAHILQCYCAYLLRWATRDCYRTLVLP